MRPIQVKTYKIPVFTRQELLAAEAPQYVPEGATRLKFSGYDSILPLLDDDPDQLYIRSSFIGYKEIERLLIVAGHDPSKIDTAVPQTWWDEMYKLSGEPPRAFWTYEGDGFAGEPLWIDQVLLEYRKAIATAIFSELTERYENRRTA